MGRILVIGMISLLVACSLSGPQAPVVLGTTIEPIPKEGMYRVKKNETLYSIAWRFGLDYRYLAKRNHIARPYHIEPNQEIYLRGHASNAPKILSRTSPKLFKRTSLVTMPLEQEPHAKVTCWRWPAYGKVIGTFSSLNKGINISGYLKAPIWATAKGKVVYAGNGLRGYGNLIIIKHNSSYLTAYAHASLVLVKAGDWVRAGQKIAEMGSSGSPRVMLHFEIRYNGRPINPLSYLKQ